MKWLSMCIARSHSFLDKLSDWKLFPARLTSGTVLTGHRRYAHTWLISMVCMGLFLGLAGCTPTLLPEEGVSLTPKLPPAPSEPDSLIPTYCSESQYWEDVSDQFPYPGMNCEQGPAKTIGITVHIARKINSEGYVQWNGYTMPEAVDLLVDQLNDVFSPHGIQFQLRRIVYLPGESPALDTLPKGKEGLEQWYETSMEETYAPADLNIIIKPYLGNSCITGQTLRSSIPISFSGTSRCQITTASTLVGHPLVHEVGHWLGLLHTHHTFGYLGRDTSHDTISDVDADTQGQDFKVRGPHWVNSLQDCHREGDYICDTSYDCSTFCQNAIGCKGLLGKGPNPACPEYAPPLHNVMSYSAARLDHITSEQGARARYFLMYRLRHTVQGNQLREW